MVFRFWNHEQEELVMPVQGSGSRVAVIDKVTSRRAIAVHIRYSLLLLLSPSLVTCSTYAILLSAWWSRNKSKSRKGVFAVLFEFVMLVRYFCDRHASRFLPLSG